MCNSLKAKITRQDEYAIGVQFSDFTEAEWILQNSEEVFSRLSSKWENDCIDRHWLDGYNKEKDNRNTFHWTCVTSANKMSGCNKLPRDMICDWERWLEVGEQEVFRRYAERAGSFLISVFKNKAHSGRAEPYVDEFARNSYVLCRLIEYPKSRGTGLLALEHYDPSLLTLLYGASEGGLEIEDKETTWQSLPHGEDSYVVYGRWLEYIDGHLKATLHRVQNIESQGHRYSLQCFLLVDVDRLWNIQKDDIYISVALKKIRLHYVNTLLKYKPNERWSES